MTPQERHLAHLRSILNASPTPSATPSRTTTIDELLNQRRAQERMDAVDAQPCGDKVFIRVDAKRGRQRVHAWVTGVSYTGDPGYKIAKVTYSDKYVKAKQFSAEAGRSIARQMAGNFGFMGVTLEDK